VLEAIQYFLWLVIGLLVVVLVLVVALSIIYVSSIRRTINRRINKRWRSLPTLVEYTARNPGCRTALGVQCVRCKSLSIHNVGMATVADKRRRFICGGCGKTLYRGQV
jgi:hypothetical protein